MTLTLGSIRLMREIEPAIREHLKNLQNPWALFFYLSDEIAEPQVTPMQTSLGIPENPSGSLPAS